MKELIAYFSRAGENYVNGTIKPLKIGNTEVVANMIRENTGADVFKIVPQVSYSDSYNECIDEAQADQRRNARPALTGYPESLDEYDVIYLGYPNYWGTMPMCMFTFLEHFNFSGKTIRPFCTHEGSGMGSSVSDIKRLCLAAKVESGLSLHGATVNLAEESVKKWLK